MDELKPCPFCGGTAEIVRKGTARQSMVIACEDCGGGTESGEVYGLTAPENWLWNRRPVTVSEGEAEVLEQCRLNGMGAEREARLMAEVQELRDKYATMEEARDAEATKVANRDAEVERLCHALETQCVISVTNKERLDHWRGKAEEAERKLAEVERNALERAAKVCEGIADIPGNSYEVQTAKYCAKAIRALMKEGGE